MHLACQFLAAAGKNFLEPQLDDSHTNLGFNSDLNQFESRPLVKSGTKLAFNLKRFALLWTNTDEPEIVLQGKTHGEIVMLLKDAAQRLGFTSTYHFNLHYDLPFEFDGNYHFELKSKMELEKIITRRQLANRSLQEFLTTKSLCGAIRVWPHHFDTGAFVVLDDGSGKSVGMGMAIPDPIIDKHYFYVSGYRGHEAIATTGLEKLSLGQWESENFKGGVLQLDNLGQTEIVAFLEEAFNKLTT